MFIENESDPKKKQQNKKNAENWRKLRITHCLGRCTYAQKMFKKVRIIAYMVYG